MRFISFNYSGWIGNQKESPALAFYILCMKKQLDNTQVCTIGNSLDQTAEEMVVHR